MNAESSINRLSRTEGSGHPPLSTPSLVETVVASYSARRTLRDRGKCCEIDNDEWTFGDGFQTLRSDDSRSATSTNSPTPTCGVRRSTNSPVASPFTARRSCAISIDAASHLVGMFER